jgi:hypothetical protein
MQVHWGKMKINLVWPCTKTSRSGFWRTIYQIMDTKVQTDTIIPNNKPANIIRVNEEEKCLLLQVAIFWKSVIFTFSVKGINHHSINRWQYGSEQRKVSFVWCRMKKLRSFCWWYCSSAQLRMEHCCHLYHTLCRKSTWFAVWHISATYTSHQGDLWWYHRHLHTEMCNKKLIAGIHRAFICPVVVTVVLALIFCDQECILVIDYLPNG